MVLHPDMLANALDLWALRREKILAVLDVHAARRARKLADTCRVLAQASYFSRVGEEVWRSEWRTAREHVLETLASSRPGMRPAELEAEPHEAYADPLRPGQHRSISETRIRAQRVDEDDRDTLLDEPIVEAPDAPKEIGGLDWDEDEFTEVTDMDIEKELRGERRVATQRYDRAI